MDKENHENNDQKVQADSIDGKITDVKNDKNYDYLEPGDVYSFEVGM